MKRLAVVTIGVALLLASSAYAQNMVIRVPNVDTISREVQSFSGNPINNYRVTTNPHGCIFYGYGKASDNNGFYRYFEYTSVLMGRGREECASRIQNKLLGYGAMDVRIYEITPGRYVPLLQ
jgi:hypothetical protein